jgi:hypothetical protein
MHAKPGWDGCGLPHWTAALHPLCDDNVSPRPLPTVMSPRQTHRDPSPSQVAVARATKGSAPSLAARSHLLRINALHQRAHRFVARHHDIPGPVNAMVDDTSRQWELSDTDLLTHFNSVYPQTTCWQVQTLSSTANSTLTGALSRKRATLASLLSDTPPPPPLGGSG